MNSQINNKFLTTKSDDGKTIKHTQWSYLDLIKLKNCDETKNCSEYDSLGGNRFNEIELLK
jgi:hypothetical protein